MAENDAMEGKDLALNEVIKEAFKQKMEADQKGEENFINPVLQIGGTTFELEVKQDEKDNKYKMHILGVHILTLDENNELQFNDGWEEALSSRIKECGDIISEQDGKDLIENLKQMDKEIQKENEQKAEEQKDEKDLSEDMDEKEEDEPEKDEDKKKKPEQKEESEQEKMKRDSKNWQEMDLDREFTDTDTLRKWVKDVLHESPEKVYRRQTGAHDFEYMAEINGEYKPLELSTDLEGKNTRQEVYILKEDGTLELDEVDSLLLTKDGTYGIATKVPDGVSTDMTKSFSVTRTKDGKYLATQLIEKSGQNRDPKLPGKEIGDRTQSVYKKEDFIEQKEEIDNNDMDIAEDGVTVDEIGLYEYFKKKGYTPDAIDRMIKDIEENEISADEAENKEKEANKNNKREEGGRGPWDGSPNKRSRW